MTSADGHGGPRGHTAAAAGLIAAVTVVLYWRALEAGFVGDDFMILHRVRMVESAAGLLRFFRGEFFRYYRPLGFVLHTVDWWIAGADPRQFHLTNLLLHAMASVLVVLIGRALSPKSLAGPTAALLFALHASNHEAVVWVSARFDLLATVLSLAAIWSLVRQHRGSDAIAPVLFFLAVLSKESAVALPIAVAGYWVFLRRASTAATLQRLVPWLTALALYSVLRQVAGGISAVGGSGRLPKLAAFAIVLGGIVWLGSGRSLRAMAWLRQQQARFFIALAAIIAAMAGVAAAGGRLGQFAAAKLAVAGFVLFNLASPALDLFERPFYLDPRTVSYWAGGTIALGALVLVLRLLWRRLVSDPRQWVLASLLIAALLPISALTEGTRYLYLPSAAVSLIAGVLIAEYRGRGRGIVLTATALVLTMSAVQISVKLRDWIWAGDMTREGAQLVEAARPPGCGEDHVVFLTAPVAVRGVYTHFYYETFELPRGCMPAVFQVLTRVMRLDTAVDVRWDGPSRIVITAPAYRNNFVTSGDLRHFDRPIGGEVPTMTLQTPLGELRAESVGEGQRLTLSLAPDVQPARVRFFYFSDGRIRPFPAYPGTTARGP